VLDVATGTGNTAIAAARRLCAVTGMDYVPALLERGRARAAAEGLSIAFEGADTEALPAERFNQADDDTLVVPAEYLEVVAIKR
jgi:ubiquinone/menaquinone biosynthesis C-methylase UbiE